jgi:hypothetical protein
MVAEWYKGLPHLPKNGQQWLAKSSWWIALIWVVVGAVGIFGVLSITLFAGALLTAVGGAAGAAIAGFGMIVIWVYLAVAVVSLVITIMAISPLKAMKKRGWTLLFITILLEVVSKVVYFVFDYNFFSLVWGILMSAVVAYFLFEIRSFFDGQKMPSATAKKM